MIYIIEYFPTRKDLKFGYSFRTLEMSNNLGTTVTNKNLIHEAIKRRFNSGNAYYNLVQHFLFSALQSENLKIRAQKLSFCLWVCMDVKLVLCHYGRDIDEVKKTWIYTSTPPYALVA
jgi:hypothetical protein